MAWKYGAEVKCPADAAAPICAISASDVVKLATDTEGRSLKAGLDNLMTDLGRGSLTITDEGAFEVGKDVAASAGAVVFEDDMFIFQDLQAEALDLRGPRALT